MSAQIEKGYHRSVFSVTSLLFMLTLAVSCLALMFAVLAARNADLAMIDWLTGLLNRRGFYSVAEREHEREDVGRCLSCVVIDIDAFKRINDEHGHAAGDEVLKALARVLWQQGGDESHVARTGGEEFCILLPKMDLDAARELADAIRLQCEQMRRKTRWAQSGGIKRFGHARGFLSCAQAVRRIDRHRH